MQVHLSEGESQDPIVLMPRFGVKLEMEIIGPPLPACFAGLPENERSALALLDKALYPVCLLHNFDLAMSSSSRSLTTVCHLQRGVNPSLQLCQTKLRVFETSRSLSTKFLLLPVWKQRL